MLIVQAGIRVERPFQFITIQDCKQAFTTGTIPYKPIHTFVSILLTYRDCDEKSSIRCWRLYRFTLSVGLYILADYLFSVLSHGVRFLFCTCSVFFDYNVLRI